MTGHGGRRTQAERDAITVEIGYAVLSAAFAAAVLFGAVAGPALLFELPATVEKVLLHVGLTVTPVLFAVRVVSVLLRFPEHRAATPTGEAAGHTATPPGAGAGTTGHTHATARRTDGGSERPGGQPSQPGRTSPDS
ncbi:hypothetical protein BM536_005900 [Streptomyces phaeoluteigriseus]|uniref:Uncharacterized protein n=1 Tax=Streptomyces phaeoluteigriseus TaxID=114686 RepID=A0A1V6MWT3_9ACTN|nr:DUF6332 family protein [Streptomyces phaeoluteigriseus]OQD56904.1 hypothetical protein BM536_005900 [Streptomyces phaeoluteigriseus]